MIRNTTDSDFIFRFQNVRRNVNDERGLGINGFQDPFIQVRLQEIEGKGLLQIIRDRRAFRLTQAGIKYCKQLPLTRWLTFASRYFP
ncbi:MAG TPA: hypothetical protein VKA09_03525 [Nitrososphaeraceae archaeon]|nr:hypothetical protein [Nitrososphaeraceae archaeon]